MGWLTDFFAGQTVKRDTSCSFCSRSHSNVGPFVEGPGDVFICPECCDAVSSKLAEADGHGQCSFCRKHSSEIGPLVQSDSEIAICASCVDLVQQILTQESLRRAKKRRSRR